MSIRGKIATWNDEKGFGFIVPNSGGNQIFVHIKDLPRGIKRLQVGAEVVYEEAIDSQGRSRAKNVKPLGMRLAFGPAVTAFVFGSAFLAFVATIAVQGRIPFFVFWLYVGMSILSLGAYYLDKSAAKKGGQRTSENTLHLLALGGGWPGAMYAQQLLRHKSRKVSFRVGFWLTVSINVSALAFLLSPYSVPHLVKFQTSIASASNLYPLKNENAAATKREIKVYLCQNQSGEKFAQATPCPAGITVLKTQ